MANIAAGYLLIADKGVHWPLLLLLLLSGLGIFAGGYALDDITSPRVSPPVMEIKPQLTGRHFRAEIFLAAGLFLFGLFVALLTGYLYAPGGRVFMTALSLLSLFLLYGLMTKTVPVLGALNMALCGAFGVLLGMSPAPEIEWAELLFPLAIFLYGYALARSAYSGRAETREKWPGFFLGWIVVTIGSIYLVFRDILLPSALPFLFLFVLITGAGFLRTFFSENGAHSGLKLFILSVPALSSAYVAGFRGVETALPVFLLVLPAWLSMRLLE